MSYTVDVELEGFDYAYHRSLRNHFRALNGEWHYRGGISKQRYTCASATDVLELLERIDTPPTQSEREEILSLASLAPRREAYLERGRGFSATVTCNP